MIEAKTFQRLLARFLTSRDRAANTLLRLLSLVAKLAFTLYVGRYLGLADLGTYGLIAAYVAVAVNLLGMRFDYVVSRDIVDSSPLDIARKLRDQTVFLGLNYAALGVILALAMAGPLKSMKISIIFLVFALSILENYTAVMAGNFISLKKPVLSSVLFFMRAAMWTFPVMALGVFSPAYRTVETILAFWIAGVVLSLVATLIAWRHLPWREALRIPVGWEWIGTGIRKCWLIWLGAIGGAVVSYVDRFVVEHYLTLEYVGIASFYSSFVIAITSLLQSGVFAFSYPRLITYYKQRDDVLFRHEVWRMTIQAASFTAFMAIGVGVAVPLLGTMFNRQEFTEHAPTLWLMLLGIWLRSTTDALYFVLYARHQDRFIWMGDLLALIPALSCNMVLVPLVGFSGIGYSALVVAVFTCGWRLYCVSRPHAPYEDIGAAAEMARLNALEESKET